MPATTNPLKKYVAVIGGGPAGLMAAEVLAQHGLCVDVYDAMPSVGRKFLMAGKGGMNITHADGALRFETAQSPHPSPLPQAGEGAKVKIANYDATVLALGGGSWPQLGSDGAWVSLLGQRDIDIAALRPSNCGFDITWSTHFRERFVGEPLKSVAATFGTVRKLGECVITSTGIEGGLIYSLSSALRDEIEHSGSATLYLDLLPDWSAQRVHDEVHHPRGSRSQGSHLQSRLGLKGVKANLLREVLGAEGYADSARLAAAIKALPLKLITPRPLSEAISSAGGVRFEALDERLMLKNMPGVFCAGEMLDWEAPTGGYLLSACFASGRTAGLGTINWLGCNMA